MSTPVVSAFYDVGDVLLQNRKNLVRSLPQGSERRVVGTPITGNNTNRNTNFINRNLNNNPQIIPTSPTTSNNNNVISPRNGSPVLGNRELLTNQNLSGLRRLERSMSEPAGPKDLLSMDKNSNKNVNSSRYKTELCRPFEENGYCKYGDKCQFAHGAHELRCLARHPKYKTEPCRTFHTIGFCPYGPRCHFIHNEDERKLNQINQLKQTLPPSSSPQPLTPPRPVSQAQSIHRPKALSFSSAGFSLAMVRDSLGSTADSPPSSITDSPTMSPTFSEEYLSSSLSSSAFSPPASAPPGISSAFRFPHPDLAAPVPSTPVMAPLNVHTGVCERTLASLAAGMQAASMRNNNNSQDQHIQQQQQHNQDIFYAPPSPPDSLSGESMASSCGSPLEVSRGLRLPIFSRLSVNDD